MRVTQGCFSFLPDLTDDQITAQVQGTYPAGGVPTGDVIFTIDGRTKRRVHLTNGIATLNLPKLNLRGHLVGVAYQGDTNNAPNATKVIVPVRRAPIVSVRHKS